MAYAGWISKVLAEIETGTFAEVITQLALIPAEVASWISHRLWPIGFEPRF